MTISGDDLPAAGPQQVICACMTELFRVVINGGEMVAECSGCGSTAHRWAIAGAAQQTITFYRDTLPAADQRGAPVASAAWLDPETSGPVTGSELAAGADTEAQIRKTMGMPPPLPAYSAEMRNAYLTGGPYDGQETWIMDAGSGGLDFHISGVASYRYSGRLKDSGGPRLLALYEHVPQV